MWRSGSTREHATVRRVIAELVTYVICVFGVSVKPLWQVMTAASYWSLLAPAIEMAEVSGSYGVNGEWAFLPVAIGFGLGAVFVYAADVFMPYLVCYCSESILLLFCVQYLLLRFTHMIDILRFILNHQHIVVCTNVSSGHLLDSALYGSWCFTRALPELCFHDCWKVNNNEWLTLLK